MSHEEYIKIRNKLLYILLELEKHKGCSVIGVETELLDKWSLELVNTIEGEGYDRKHKNIVNTAREQRQRRTAKASE